MGDFSAAQTLQQCIDAATFSIALKDSDDAIIGCCNIEAALRDDGEGEGEGEEAASESSESEDSMSEDSMSD